MPDRAQPRQQMLELLVREQQRIAAREQHVAHLGMGLDVPQPLLVLRMKIIILRVADQVFVIRAGRLISQGPVENYRGEDTLRQIYLSDHKSNGREV